MSEKLDVKEIIKKEINAITKERNRTVMDNRGIFEKSKTTFTKCKSWIKETYNKKNLVNPTDKEHGHNPSCGDDITLEIKMNGDVIEDLSFTGHGCAISQASTSIMIDLLKGKTKKEAEQFAAKEALSKVAR